MPQRMTPEEQKRATDAALAKLYARQPPTAKKLSEIGKPSMIQNYQTLGQKMAKSGRRAIGREEQE